jgi:hypothetical protein
MFADIIRSVEYQGSQGTQWVELHDNGEWIFHVAKNLSDEQGFSEQPHDGHLLMKALNARRNGFDVSEFFYSDSSSRDLNS